jgi:hypothetical protein
MKINDKPGEKGRVMGSGGAQRPKREREET